MAEPTNPGQPSESASERGSPVNVNTSGNVTVTRKDVATGDVKELHTELLKQLVDCCDEQTVALKSILESTKKEIIGMAKASEKSSTDDTDAKATSKLSKAIEDLESSLHVLVTKPTGGGDESAPGGGYAQARAIQEQWKDMEELTRVGRPAFENFFKIFHRGAMTQFQENMDDVNKKVQQFGIRIADMGSATRKTMGVIDEMFKAGQGGMIGINALYEDLGAGLVKNRDALNSTFPVVMEFADQQRMLIGTLGANLEDVARSFKENREAAQAAFGDEFLERIPFEELNAIQTQILEQNRRAGVKATNAEILTSQQTRSQIQLLKDISFATGQTVKEVLKLQEEEGMTLEELRYNNLITEEQKKTMMAQATFLKAQGMEGIPELMQQIAESGGTEMFKRVEGAAMMMSVGNNEALINEMYKLTQSAAGRTPEGIQRMGELAKQIQGLDMGSTGANAVLREVSGGMAEKFGAITTQANRVINSMEASGTTLAGVRAEQIKTEGGAGATAQGWFNKFQEVVKNNLGGGGDLAIALGYNTAAVIANTLARVGGLGGGVGKLLGKLKGGGGKLLAKLGIGAAATTAGAAAFSGGPNPTQHKAAAAAASKAAGKQTAKAAAGAGVKSILKKIPLVGLLMGLGLGVSRAMDGDFVGAGGEVLSGAASLVPGMGTAASVAIDAGLFARDMEKATNGMATGPVADSKGIAPSRGDTATVAPSGVKTSVATSSSSASLSIHAMLANQTQQLMSIVSLLGQGNQVREAMLDTIGQGIGAQPSGKVNGPKTRYGRKTATNAYSPLLDGAGGW